jgi:hypothetical protein
MVASKQTSITARLLDTTEDWKEWLGIVKSKAQSGTDTNIWPYIDPSLRVLPIPMWKPTRPTYARFHDGATTITQLSPEEKEAYRDACQIYEKDDVPTYNEFAKKMDAITQHIFDTVTARNTACIIDKTTPYEKLVALKERLALSTRVRELELAREYAKNKIYNGNQDMNRWIENWESVYAECKAYDLPDVANDRP